MTSLSVTTEVQILDGLHPLPSGVDRRSTIPPGVAPSSEEATRGPGSLLVFHSPPRSRPEVQAPSWFTPFPLRRRPEVQDPSWVLFHPLPQGTTSREAGRSRSTKKLAATEIIWRKPSALSGQAVGLLAPRGGQTPRHLEGKSMKYMRLAAEMLDFEACQSELESITQAWCDVSAPPATRTRRYASIARSHQRSKRRRARIGVRRHYEYRDISQRSQNART
jgi:hypothetical protein